MTIRDSSIGFIGRGAMGRGMATLLCDLAQVDRTRLGE